MNDLAEHDRLGKTVRDASHRHTRIGPARDADRRASVTGVKGFVLIPHDVAPIRAKGVNGLSRRSWPRCRIRRTGVGKPPGACSDGGIVCGILGRDRRKDLVEERTLFDEGEESRKNPVAPPFGRLTEITEI